MNENTHCSVNGCTNEAKPEKTGPLTMNLCRNHVWDLAAWRHESAREAMAEVNDQGLLLGPTKGWTYVIRVGNGNVKIGKAGTKEKATLQSRLQTISRSHKDNDGVPVQVLAVLKGGTSTELLAHNQWLHLRVPGQMEEFYADPSLLKWAEDRGIHDDAQEAVNEFYAWGDRKHRDPKRNGAQKQAERLGVQAEQTDNEFGDW